MRMRLVMALFAALAVIMGLSLAPAQAAVVTSVEAETMTSVQGYGTFVQNDSTASGGQRLMFESNVTAQRSFSLASPTTRYTVRAFQDGDATGALIKILIDGSWAGQWYVYPNTWQTYSVNRSLAAGSHTLRIQMLNAETRNLYVDVTRFHDATTADTTAPTAPSNLRSTGKTASSVSLAWDASTDNVGVTGYQVFRGSTLVTTTGGSTLSYTDSGLSAGTAYTYTVKARDAAGNVSAASNAVTVTTDAASNERTFTAYVTGYSWYDNDPPGSAAIAYPVIHQEAAGSGTWADPTTVAVGQGMYEPGTRFYIPNLRKYFIVEDLCAGCAGNPNWLDVWVGGQDGTNEGADACMNAITGNWTAIQNPDPDYVVVSGEIYEPPCQNQYGNTPVRA